MVSNNKFTVKFFTVVILVPVAAFLLFNWYQNNASALPYYKSSAAVAKDRKEALNVPDFNFTDQDSNRVSKATLNGKIGLINYFFTSCPVVCPKMMHNLLKVQEAFAGDKDVVLLSFTVDPKRDSVAKLKEYGEKLGIDRQFWHLATGEKKDLYQFARKGLTLVATDGDGGDDDFIHSDRIVLMDKASHIRGFYDGTSSSDIDQLIKDIKRLQ